MIFCFKRFQKLSIQYLAHHEPKHIHVGYHWLESSACALSSSSFSRADHWARWASTTAMCVKTSASWKCGSLGALTFSFTSPDSRLSASFLSTSLSIILYTVFWQISFLKYNSNHSTIQNNHSKQSLNSSVEYVRFYPYHYTSKISFLSYLPLLRAHVLWLSQTGLFYCSLNVLFCHLKSCSFILSSFYQY